MTGLNIAFLQAFYNNPPPPVFPVLLVQMMSAGLILAKRTNLKDKVNKIHNCQFTTFLLRNKRTKVTEFLYKTT